MTHLRSTIDWPTDLYKYSPDAVPPIHAVSYHVATDTPPPAQNGDKFSSIFSDNLQPIATRGKKARGTLLVDWHCGNGCSIKRATLSFSYYNEISGGHMDEGLFGGGVLPAQYCPCGLEWTTAHCISQQELLTLAAQLKTSQPSIFIWMKILTQLGTYHIIYNVQHSRSSCKGTPGLFHIFWNK